MKIIENCWDDVNPWQCIFGPYLYESGVASFYIANGLEIKGNLDGEFSVADESGMVGNCMLVFRNVKKMQVKINRYTETNGHTQWSEPIFLNYGDIEFNEETDNEFYSMSGALQGFKSSISIKLHAKKFDVHILDEGEFL